MTRKRLLARNLNNAASKSLAALTTRLRTRKTKINPIAVSRIADPNMLLARYKASETFAARVFNHLLMRAVNATSINSIASPENKLLPFPVLPILRKAVLHTDRSPAARAASSERCLEKRYTLCHVRPHRSLDSTELPELLQARLMLPQSLAPTGKKRRSRRHQGYLCSSSRCVLGILN